MRKSRVAAALCVAILGSGVARATDYVWTGTAGNGNWFTANNWSPNGTPGGGDNATVSDGETATIGAALNDTGGSIVAGGAGSTIVIGSTITGGTLNTSNGGVITGNGSGILNNLTNAGTLTFNASELYLQGTINNTGIIESGGSGSGAYLFAVGGQTTTLSGGGSVLLNKSNAQIFDNGWGFINQDNLIHGYGEISAPLSNNGTVSADSSGNTLTLNQAAKTNTGTMQAINGGVLAINTSVTGTGSIVASGGTVNENANITQPLIDATGGTFNLQSGKLAVPAFVGTLNQSGGTFTAGTSPAFGAVTGNYNMTGGTLEIDLGGDQAGQFDQINIGGNATLNGQLSVQAVNGFSVGQFDDFSIVNISGSRSGTFGLTEGQVVGSFGGNNLYITFQAGDGNDVELFTGLNPAAVPVATAGPTQTAYVSGNYSTLGTGQTFTYVSYEILPGATADLALSDTLDLTGGPLYIAPGGTFNASGIVNGNIINAGLVHITARYASTFTNRGTAVFEPSPALPTQPSGPFVNGPGGTAEFEPGTYYIENFTSGPGSLVEAGPAPGPGASPVTIDIPPGQPPIQNEGETAVGDLIVNGNYTQTPTGETLFDLGGSDPIFGYSQLTVNGIVELAGTIQTDYINNFYPQIGETFDLLVASEGITLEDGWVGIPAEPGFTYALVGDDSGDTIFQETFVGVVPEPTSLSVLGMCGLGLLRRRRRSVR